MKMFCLAILYCVICCSRVTCSADARPASCSLLGGHTGLNDASEHGFLDIEWTYGKTCNSMHSCFGMTSSPDKEIVPQIPPLQIAEGTPIRFRPVGEMSIPFVIQPFQVSEEDFKLCHIDHGEALVHMATSDVIYVNQSMLQPGYNYFIVNSSSDPLIHCEFGLRLNLTVKRVQCSEEGPGNCSGHGICSSASNETQYLCTCCQGYQGKFCEDRDGCYSNPCLHGGSCLSQHAEKNTTSEYTCLCPVEYTGRRCEQRMTSLCHPNPCVNNGTCIGDKSQYNCTCLPGYGGHDCEVNIDDCRAGPCKHGICVDDVNGYKCYCTPDVSLSSGLTCNCNDSTMRLMENSGVSYAPPIFSEAPPTLRPGWDRSIPETHDSQFPENYTGYGGTHCRKRYRECQSQKLCQNGGVCINELGGYHCDCGMGYSGRNCENKVKLCQPSPCRNTSHSTCVDRGPNYECVCLPGFTGSQCEVDINDCEENPCMNGGKCRDHIGGFECRCPVGFTGQHCQFSDTHLPRVFHKGERATFPNTISPEDHQARVHNIYIVGGTLAGAVIIALVVLAGCYCRQHRSYIMFPVGRQRYTRHADESPRRLLDSAPKSRPTHAASDAAIFEASTFDYQENQQVYSPLTRALRPKKI